MIEQSRKYLDDMTHYNGIPITDEKTVKKLSVLIKNMEIDDECYKMLKIPKAGKIAISLKEKYLKFINQVCVFCINTMFDNDWKDDIFNQIITVIEKLKTNKLVKLYIDGDSKYIKENNMVNHEILREILVGTLVNNQDIFNDKTKTKQFIDIRPEKQIILASLNTMLHIKTSNKYHQDISKNIYNFPADEKFCLTRDDTILWIYKLSGTYPEIKILENMTSLEMEPIIGFILAIMIEAYTRFEMYTPSDFNVTARDLYKKLYRSERLILDKLLDIVQHYIEHNKPVHKTEINVDNVIDEFYCLLGSYYALKHVIGEKNIQVAKIQSRLEVRHIKCSKNPI